MFAGGPVKRQVIRTWSQFWYDYEVPGWLLRRFRLVFFGLFALDAWLQIEHASRYGAGDFNVSHFPWLDGALPSPSRAGMLLVFVLQAYLALRIALGAANKWTIGALAALHGYGYFISQLNSYQHHYLLFLMLAICAMVPWHEPDKVVSWAVRLLLVQISILYFWAAVAKTGGEWLDGSTLSRQVGPEWGRALIDRIGGFGYTAKLIMVGELFLAVAIQIRLLKPFAFVAGVLLHISIEAFGFQIGMFSWFMVAVYVIALDRRLPVWAFAAGLVSTAALVQLKYPAHLFELGDTVVQLFWFAVGVHLLVMPESLAARLRPATDAIASLWSRLCDRAPTQGAATWISPAVGAALGAGLLLAIPLGGIVVVAIVAAVAGLALAYLATDARQRFTLGIGHVAACLIVLLCHQASDQARRYYEFLGGDERRRQDLPAATAAYEQVREIDPDYAVGRMRLGDLYRRTNRPEQAVTEYEASVRLEPEDYRAYYGLALIHDAAKRGPQALAAAQAALPRVGNKLATKLDANTRKAIENHRSQISRIAARWRP